MESWMNDSHPPKVVIRRLGLSKDYPLSPSVPSSQETNAIAIRNVSSSSSSISRLWISLFHRARKFTRIFILARICYCYFFSSLHLFLFFSFFFFSLKKDKSVARKLTCCAIPFFSLYLNSFRMMLLWKSTCSCAREIGQGKGRMKINLNSRFHFFTFNAQPWFLIKILLLYCVVIDKQISYRFFFIYKSKFFRARLSRN